MPIPNSDYSYNATNLKPVPYANVPLNQPWHDYNIQHDLTDQGLLTFEADWNQLLAK